MDDSITLLMTEWIKSMAEIQLSEIMTMASVRERNAEDMPSDHCHHFCTEDSAYTRHFH